MSKNIPKEVTLYEYKDYRQQDYYPLYEIEAGIKKKDRGDKVCIV
jgi:hypothetical protein